MRGIRISYRANIHHFDIPLYIANIEAVRSEHVTYIAKTVGLGLPHPEGEWEREDGTSVVAWGWEAGNAYINRFDMPPMGDEHYNERFYGDIILLLFNTDSGDIMDFTIEAFNAWYDEAMGGFESLGEEDTDQSDIGEYDDDDSFIDDRPPSQLSTYSDPILDDTDSD